MFRTCSLLIVALAACGDSPVPNADAVTTPIADATASIDADTGPAFDLTVTFGDTTRRFDRAYFNTDTNDTKYYVEAYIGGEDGCPTKTSATPDATLISGDIDIDSPASTGISGLFDFAGELLETTTFSSATTANFTNISRNGDELILTADLVFAEGTITGTFFATFCDSIHGP